MRTTANKSAIFFLACAMMSTLSSCANAIPEPHEIDSVVQSENKGDFYNALASSEMTKIKNKIEAQLKKNGDVYETAGAEVRSSYNAPAGIYWSYTLPDEGIGYILKVWTPAGGTFNSEETAMSLESYTEAPESGHEHYGETAEEHAAHADEDEVTEP